MNPGATATRTALLAIGAFTFITASVRAQNVPDPVAHDIFLGYRISGSPDAYLVRLGNYDTYFKNLSEGTTVTLTGVGGVGADLVSKYGSDWHSNPDAHWGIFGSSLAAQAPLLYASRERTAPASPSEPWPILATDKRNIVGGYLSAVIQGNEGYRSRTHTLNSTVATFQPPAVNLSAFEANYIFQTSPAVDFGAESLWNIEGDFAAGAGESVLDLYRVGGTSVLRVGFFSISSTGTITFTRQTTVAPADVDTDGDGILDSLEVLAGTSPTNSSDFFRVQSTTVAGGNASLTLKPAANRTYKLFYSETLLSGSWTEITAAAPSPPATIARYVTNGSPATTFSFNDADPVRRAKAKGFYRIEVSLNP